MGFITFKSKIRLHFYLVFFSLFVLISLVSFASWGDAFDRGVKAFERGDYKTALKQWHFSTLDGNGTAANNIGKMYRNGNGVVQDHKNAIQWFFKGHRLGNAESSYNLAIAYDQGMGGLEKSEGSAFKFYRASAKRGFANAQYNLGLRYASGIGVRADLVLSYMWFDILVNSSGFLNKGTIKTSSLTILSIEDALVVMDLIEKNISTKELELARQLARECVANDYATC